MCSQMSISESEYLFPPHVGSPGSPLGAMGVPHVRVCFQTPANHFPTPICHTTSCLSLSWLFRRDWVQMVATIEGVLVGEPPSSAQAPQRIPIDKQRCRTSGCCAAQGQKRFEMPQNRSPLARIPILVAPELGYHMGEADASHPLEPMHQRGQPHVPCSPTLNNSQPVSGPMQQWVGVFPHRSLECTRISSWN